MWKTNLEPKTVHIKESSQEKLQHHTHTGKHGASLIWNKLSNYPSKFCYDVLWSQGCDEVTLTVVE